VELNFGLGAVAVATSPGIVPEMEIADQPDGECDLLESRTAASVHGATIHCGQTMQKGAAVVLLQEVLIRKVTTFRVKRELRRIFPKYECYIAAGSHVDVGNDNNDRTLTEEIVQAWVNEMWTLPEKTIDTVRQSRSHHEWHHLSTLQRRQHQQNVWSKTGSVAQ